MPSALDVSASPPSPPVSVHCTLRLHTYDITSMSTDYGKGRGGVLRESIESVEIRSGRFETLCTYYNNTHTHSTTVFVYQEFVVFDLAASFWNMDHCT